MKVSNLISNVIVYKILISKRFFLNQCIDIDFVVVSGVDVGVGDKVDCLKKGPRPIRWDALRGGLSKGS